MNSISAALSADEDHGRTSEEEEEEGAGEPSCDRQVRSGTIAGKWLIKSSEVPQSHANQLTKQDAYLSGLSRSF